MRSRRASRTDGRKFQGRGPREKRLYGGARAEAPEARSPKPEARSPKPEALSFYCFGAGGCEAALVRREMRRDACALWITPFDAAFAIWRTAWASTSFVLVASPAAAASRNLRTLVRSVERTRALRTRCVWACRCCFSAHRVLATQTPKIA